MLEIRRILFPTDFSETATQALTHALFLAEQLDAEVHMLHAIVLHEEDPHSPSHHFPSPEEIFRRLYDIASSELAGLAEAHEHRPVEIREAQERGFSAAEVILDYAQDHDVDLVVMGTHGRRGPRRLLLGSVSEEVVRLARCPVMTLRHEEDGGGGIEAVERILVPVDFSDHSLPLLRHAVALAASYGAAVDLLHVIQEHAYPYFYGPVSAPSLGEHVAELQKRAASALDDLMAGGDGGAGVEYRKHVAEGQAADEIVGFAEREGSDLICIATHGLTGLDRVLVGSTAEQVVRTALCPVLTVKSFGKSLLPDAG